MNKTIGQYNADEEKSFLENYDITKFDRPSVTTDIAVFTIRSEITENYRRDDIKQLSVLLINRAEHPYKGYWALPGGFLRMEETVEECAFRETLEETGAVPNAIMPVGIFSETDRDPRGRVISNAYVSVILDGSISACGGSDAAQARWFDVDFTKEPDSSTYLLELKNDEEKIKVELEEISSAFGFFRYRTIGESALAFDHAAILASGLSALRRCTGDMDIVFDFLPEKFTLSELQCVQETILNVSLLSANFRRKAAEYVEETDEFITGAGHRPARLYRRKK